MNSARCVKTAVLLLALSLFAGCGSKEEKQPANQGQPGKPGAASAPATVPAVSEKDKTDAKAEGAKVIAQMKAGEYLPIYKEASPGFKALGTEPQFISMMEQTRKKTGKLNAFKETGLETGVDKRQMVTYSVDYDNVKSNLRLSFLRSKEGKMELVGLTQKDDVVKNPKAVKAAQGGKK